MNKIFKNFRAVYFVTFVFIISISFSGCAWTPFWGDEDKVVDIWGDEVKVVELESEFEEFEEAEAKPEAIEELEETVSSLSSRVVELESEFKEFEEAEAKPEAIEELEETVSSLSSRLVELESEFKEFEEAEAKPEAIEELEETVSSLSSRISEIEEMQEGGSGEGATNSAEIETLKDTIHELQSQIEDLKNNINEIEFEAKLKTSPRPKMLARGPSRDGAKSGYDKALRLLSIKKYKESLRLFQSLDNRRTPTNLRDNVVFWIGQSYFVMENYEKAIEKFNIVIDKYGSGNKVVDSMYTIGVAYNALGEKSKALFYLEHALNKGPSADLRRKIKTKIKEIEA